MSYRIEEAGDWGGDALARAGRRREIERRLKRGEKQFGEGALGLGRFVDMPRAVGRVLGMLGLAGRARAEAETLVLEEMTFRFRRLPAEFDGFRILHLSDFHCAASPGVAARVAKALEGVDYDAVALTGDYQDSLSECERDDVEREMRVLREALRGPVFFTLGNHDHGEAGEILEEVGFVPLVNRHAVLRRGGESIRLAGVDDPHFYRTHLMDGVREVSRTGFTVLLSHSPEVHHSPKLGMTDLVLCGHTHGGQLCLPGGHPIVSNARCPRWSVRGRWQIGPTRGYTSRGVGTSGVRARLNCPGEATVHVLRRADTNLRGQ